MNDFQSGKTHNINKRFPGCLGITMNLFDVSAGLASGSTKLLIDKPHHDGSSFSRSRSDVTTMLDHLNANRVEDKKIMSKIQKKSSNRKSSGTPMKMLIAQEMSEVVECKQKSPTNLVAKLMGLDSLSMQFPNQRSHSKGCTQHNQSKSLSGIQVEFPQHGRSYSESDEYGGYNDIYDKWQQSLNENGSPNEKKMDHVCQKLKEAKRLAPDEKPQQSKEFQDAVEVLSSNRDIFLKFLQDPNSLVSRDLQSVPSPPYTKRITVLKPAKMMGGAKFSKDLDGYSPPESEDVYDIQPTRIVVLKPGHGDKLSEEEDDRVQESKEMAMGHRRDEVLLPSSSVFSNGCIGDDSSFNKSDTEFANGNLSDSEALSPISRHSWEFLNCQYSASSYSQAAYSPESSVCREAKRRLSERWALMASTNQTTFVEQRDVRTSSSTLGEMLSLSEKVNEDDKDKKETPKHLLRSKSLPSSVYSDRLNGELPGSGEEQTKKTSGKSSSKWSISNLFFSRSKKSRKEKSFASHCTDESQSKGGETSESMVYPHEKLGSSVLSHLNENHVHPSPISVLDQLFEEDDNSFPDSSGKHISSHLLRSNLLDKSPRIESVARTLSWDGDCFESPSPHLVTSPESQQVITEEEKQDWFDFIQKVISLASPLDPSIRYKLCSQYDNEPLPEAKKRQMRSYCMLVFDCVNATILDDSADMARRGAHISSEQVWGQLKDWFLDDGSSVCREDEDITRLVVVMNEVVGKGWVDLLRLEIDNLGLEIERKLLEEALDDLVGKVL